MENSTLDYVQIFKALSDTNRLNIVEMLSCGELCACMLLEKLNITQPTLSHHMKALADCGLVKARKEGIWMHYSLNRQKIGQMKAYIGNISEPRKNCICKERYTECTIKK